MREWLVLGVVLLSSVALAADATPAALEAAVRSHDRATVERLLDGGMRVDTRLTDGKTPLMVALRLADADMALALLERGANPNARDAHGLTPLIIAVYGRSEFPFKGSDALPMVEMLLARGAAVDAQTSDGETAFGLAAHNGRLDLVRVLRAAGADVETRDAMGRNVLGYAFSAPNGITSVPALIDAGLDIDARDEMGSTVLMQVAGDGNLEAVRLLLEHGAQVNAVDLQRRTALMLAIERNRPAVVRLLLEHGAAVGLADTEGGTALMRAARAGQLTTVQDLLEHGADASFRPSPLPSPLQAAAGGDHVEVVALLWDHIPAAARAADGEEALRNAAGPGAFKAVRALVERGVDVNARDPVHLTTPLGQAERGKQPEIARYLAEHGATHVR